MNAALNNNYKLIVITIMALFCSRINGQDPYSCTKIMSFDSIPASELFKYANLWLAESYKSSKDVIQLNDKESGQIVCNGVFNYKKDGMLKYGAYEGFISYTLKLYFKDNRVKTEMINFQHDGQGFECDMGLLTTAVECPVKTSTVAIRNELWKDMKSRSKEYFNMVCESISDYIGKMKNEANW